jgi:ATP-dependent RNA helicase DOB1
LQHYIFPTGGKGIHLIVDEKGNFREQNFAKAIAVLEEDLDLGKIVEDKKNKKKQSKMTMQQEMKKLITLIIDKGLDPCIVFSFSKRECEQYSMSLRTCDFNTEDEKAQIDTIYQNAMSTLSADDQNIPMITQLPLLLKRGIGIHHGGLIPIVKEVIELLFQEGLLKVLFTTETFAMGINMPAKTVVFTGLEKFDGD